MLFLLNQRVSSSISHDKKTISATARTTANVPTTMITIFIFSGSVPTASNAKNDMLYILDIT